MTSPLTEDMLAYMVRAKAQLREEHGFPSEEEIAQCEFPTTDQMWEYIEELERVVAVERHMRGWGV